MFEDDCFGFAWGIVGLIAGLVIGMLVIGTSNLRSKLYDYENANIEYETCDVNGDCHIEQFKFKDYFYHREVE